MKGKKKKIEHEKLKGFFHEFKAFAIKGNMIDMAVGVIVGGAFTALVTAIVSHIATPMIGILIGVDFKSLEIELPRLYGNAEPTTLGIGLFINSVINFVVIAFTVFIFVKALNKFRKKQDAPPTQPPPSADVQLLTEIRDILKTQNTECGMRNRGNAE